MRRKRRKRYFNPRSPHGERHPQTLMDFTPVPFQSTLPARGATNGISRYSMPLLISIHAPRTGSDGTDAASVAQDCHFNPRSPHGERRALFVQKGGVGHFNPRSPHGERLGGPPAQPHQDGQFQSTLPARGATVVKVRVRLIEPFQSTLPARGATIPARRVSRGSTHFNPRSPHGERQKKHILDMGISNFNPRSPHGERHPPDESWERTQSFQSTLPARGATFSFVNSGYLAVRFQSTLPARGATRLGSICRVAMPISIHAPRTGSDRYASFSSSSARHFNPRSPHGERQKKKILQPDALEFQSTLPARGATHVRLNRKGRPRHFNPRSPHGERRKGKGASPSPAPFQSTLPARGATQPAQKMEG